MQLLDIFIFLLRNLSALSIMHYIFGVMSVICIFGLIDHKLR